MKKLLLTLPLAVLAFGACQDRDESDVQERARAAETVESGEPGETNVIAPGGASTATGAAGASGSAGTTIGVDGALLPSDPAMPEGAYQNDTTSPTPSSIEPGTQQPPPAETPEAAQPTSPPSL